MCQFDHLDTFGSGTLAVRDLVMFVKQLTGFSDAQAAQFMANIDVNGDGRIDRREFSAMWSLIFA